MVRHILLLTLDDSAGPERMTEYAAGIKNRLEALDGKIEGLISIKVYTNLLESSNIDVVLDTVFTDQAALDNYQSHPEHLKAAQYVRSVVKERRCADYHE